MNSLYEICITLYTAQARGAISVLVKYIAMVQEHSNQVLPIAIRVGSMGPNSYNQAANTLAAGMFGTLLPELSVGLVLLQLQTPLLIADCDCIPLLSGLLELLDKFNRLAPDCLNIDQDDIAWPKVKSMYMYCTCSRSMCMYFWNIGKVVLC